MAITPAQRSLRARLGGLSTAARGHVNTAPARARFAERFYQGIPDDLAPSERDRRAAAARRLYFAQLAYRSSLTRGQRKAAPVTETSGTALPEVRNGAATPTG